MGNWPHQVSCYLQPWEDCLINFVLGALFIAVVLEINVMLRAAPLDFKGEQEVCLITFILGAFYGNFWKIYAIRDAPHHYTSRGSRKFG